MKRKRFKIKLIAYYAFLIVLFPFTILLFWLNYRLKKTHYTIIDEKLPKEMHGLKIVHISDLHDATFGKDQSKLISYVQEERPDIIVITGDLIDSNRTNLEKSMRFVNGVKEIAPIYYVAGNHESRTDKYDELIPLLQNAGVNIVNDTAVRYIKNGEVLTIAGLKDPEFAVGKKKKEYLHYAGKKIQDIINDINGEYVVLLCHRPELFDSFINNKIDLVFCGHAHGGQIRLPFLGGILSPGQGLFPKYTSGIYQNDQTKMVVSRGLGNSAFPFRINNTPEIIVVTLNNK